MCKIQAKCFMCCVWPILFISLAYQDSVTCPANWPYSEMKLSKWKFLTMKNQVLHFLLTLNSKYLDIEFYQKKSPSTLCSKFNFLSSFPCPPLEISEFQKLFLQNMWEYSFCFPICQLHKFSSFEIAYHSIRFMKLMDPLSSAVFSA